MKGTYDEENCKERSDFVEGDLRGAVDGGEDNLDVHADEGLDLHDGCRDGGRDLRDEGLNGSNGSVLRRQAVWHDKGVNSEQMNAGALGVNEDVRSSVSEVDTLTVRSAIIWEADEQEQPWRRSAEPA